MSRSHQDFDSREHWLQQRQKKLTASNLGALLLATSDEEWQKAKARFHGEKGTDRHENDKMAHGLAHEKHGVHEYQKTTGRSVPDRSVETGEWESEKDGLRIYLLKTEGTEGINIQATPDGFVGERGLLEVKCPYNRPPRNKIPLRDYIQMNTLLECTDRKWCDYVSWTQDGTKIHRVHRDSELFKVLLQRYKRILTALTEDTASPPFKRPEVRKIEQSVAKSLETHTEYNFYEHDYYEPHERYRMQPTIPIKSGGRKGKVLNETERRQIMHLLDLAESEKSRVYRLEYMGNPDDPIQLDEGEAATVKVDKLVMHIKRDSNSNSTHILAKETGVQLVGDGTIHIVSKTSLHKDGTLERKGGGNSDQVTLVETAAKTKQASLTQKRIAELTGTHEKTIGKLKMARDEQNCERQMDENNVLRTTELPAAGKQGGFRWCRLNEEQKSLCTRIAIENPQLSVGQIRNRLLEACPDLKVSESTIWRSLNASNLQMLRAKMRDPRSEGTPAHAAEKEAFLREQKKGADGMLGGHNLFFMDETNVSLNLTAKRAWGTSKTSAEVKHAKGKTMTIGVYAGIGLVSGTNSSSSASFALAGASSAARAQAVLAALGAANVAVALAVVARLRGKA